MAATPPPSPLSSPEHIARRTRSRLSIQGPATDPSDRSQESNAVSDVSRDFNPGPVPFLPGPASDSSHSPLESSQVSDETQGLDILQRQPNMVVPRPVATLDTVLLEAISNMVLPRTPLLRMLLFH